MLCQRCLPDSDYSSTQLKAKAKRQCKVCVAALQATQALLPPSQTLTIPKDIGPRFASVCLSLNDLRSSEQLAGLQQLEDLLIECEPRASICTRIPQW